MSISAIATSAPKWRLTPVSSSAYCPACGRAVRETAVPGSSNGFLGCARLALPYSQGGLVRLTWPYFRNSS